MTTSNNPLDDAAEALVSLIKNISIEADCNKSAVQQHELSSKLVDSLKKTFEATSKTSNDNFDAKMETVSQHLASMNNEIVEIAKVLKCAMSAQKWGGGDIDGSSNTVSPSVTSVSTQSKIGSFGKMNMGEKIAILNKRIDELWLQQYHVVIENRKEVSMKTNSVKQELEKRLEALEKQQQGAKSQKGRLEQQDLTRLLSCLNVMPLFSYRETFSGLDIKGSRELIKNILTCFAAGVAYNIPVGYNIKEDKKVTTWDACRRDFRDKLLIHLKNLMGHLPRIEEEKDGSYSLHYA